MCFIVVCTLIDNDYASLIFSQTFFSYWVCILSEFAKGFERKVCRVQVAHLHKLAQALSSLSRCFQLLLVYYLFSEIALQTKSGKYFQIWFFPRFGGKKWRNSEHAHASHPGLSPRPPGFSPYIGGKKGEFRDWTILYGEQVSGKPARLVVSDLPADSKIGWAFSMCKTLAMPTLSVNRSLVPLLAFDQCCNSLVALVKI